MDFLIYVKLYGIIAVSIAWTSYLTIFRPSISLLEEILEEENRVYKGITGFIIWTLLATIGAPFMAIILLTNNNENSIEKFAVTLANRTMKHDE